MTVSRVQEKTICPDNGALPASQQLFILLPFYSRGVSLPASLCQLQTIDSYPDTCILHADLLKTTWFNQLLIANQ